VTRALNPSYGGASTGKVDVHVFCEGFELCVDLERTFMGPDPIAVGRSPSNAKHIASQYRLRHHSYRSRHSRRAEDRPWDESSHESSRYIVGGTPQCITREGGDLGQTVRATHALRRRCIPPCLIMGLQVLVTHFSWFRYVCKHGILQWWIPCLHNYG
jgi:hypothetical protein